MTDKNVRPIWSDDDLDNALGALRAERGVEPDLASARQALVAKVSNAPVGLSRRWGGWGGALVAAAAVLALIGSAVVVQQVISADRPDPSDSGTEARERLMAAAARIKPLPAPRAGQYSYLIIRRYNHSVQQAKGYTPPARLMTTPPPGTYVSPDPGDWATSRTINYVYKTEYWVPARMTDTWRRVYTYGDQHFQSTASPPPYRKPKVEIKEAPCGDWGSKPSCRREHGLGRATPDFLAKLPRDPEKLLAQLRAPGAGPAGRRDSMVLHELRQFLEMPRMPADVRRALLGALALLPNLRVVENVADQSGRIGTAFRYETTDWAIDMIVDEKTGAYLGQRTANRIEIAYAGPPGIVERTSVQEVIVDGMGQRP
ncbi:CU044_5270 family protein [Kribbella sp. NBC_01245]|uniref:CU044_5270 family protein n=1 Tax=Kribbella sp. NBC_01245 TaxID=2903578 RepID=UPI002E2B8616|nr:CU044_5270 family protein [Kribbella sp. NBC_01245]